MREENKKTEVDSKIMSFQITDEEIQDPAMDRYVRESLIREADELEKKINANQELAGVEAPEDMFQSIVRELKKRGTWEEDGTEEGSPDAAADGDAEADRDTEAEPDTIADRDMEAAPDTAVDRDAKAAPGEGRAEAAQKEAAAENLEALYARLPEEDQRALALGKEIARKREKRAEKRRRRKKVFRIAGVAAACLVVVFGLSMTSGANRRLVKRMWDGFMAEVGFKIDTDYVGNGETVRSKSIEEIEAMNAISEQLGVSPIDFLYLPKGMQYEGYEIVSESYTYLFYSYQDILFYVTLLNADKESSFYFTYDDEAVSREKITNNEGINVEVWEVNLDLDVKTYVAEFKLNGWRYILNGTFPLEEMEKIIKNMMIL